MVADGTHDALRCEGVGFCATFWDSFKRFRRRLSGESRKARAGVGGVGEGGVQTKGAGQGVRCLRPLSNGVGYHTEMVENGRTRRFGGRGLLEGDERDGIVLRIK